MTEIVIEDSHAPTVMRRQLRPVRRVATSPWTRFLVRRACGLVLVLVALVVTVFAMVQLIPGDPVSNALGADAQPSEVERLRHEAGLDRPLADQFVTYVGNLLHGDLGRGFLTNQSVTDLVLERVGSSLELAATALVVVLVLGVSIGMLAAALTSQGRHPRLEWLFTAVTTSVGAVPDYLMATVLAFVFAVHFRLLPVAGGGGVEYLILPALAVSLHSIATLSRIVRLETLNVLAQDYIRTARSDGLPGWLIYGRCVLPNVLTAALTVGGLIFASLLGGAVVIENVYARPGLGTALVQAVIAKDYPIIQGITLMLGLTVVVVNTLVDVALGLLDPRSMAHEA